MKFEQQAHGGELVESDTGNDMNTYFSFHQDSVIKDANSNFVIDDTYM